VLRYAKQRLKDVGTIKTLCQAAEAHALREGQDEPGAEHFLLAALDLPDGTARRAFQRVGADPAALEPAIARQYAEPLRALGIDEIPAEPAPLKSGKGLYRAAASGQEVLQALAANRASGGLIGAHVAAVVAAMPHGVAARALRAMGVDLAALRTAAQDEARAAL
jgi:hypothetical protein